MSATTKPVLTLEEEREFIELLVSIKDQLTIRLGKPMSRKAWAATQAVALESFLHGRRANLTPRLWVGLLRGEDLTLEQAEEINGASEQEGGSI